MIITVAVTASVTQPLLLLLFHCNWIAIALSAWTAPAHVRQVYIWVGQASKTYQRRLAVAFAKASPHLTFWTVSYSRTLADCGQKLLKQDGRPPWAFICRYVLSVFFIFLLQSQ